MKFIINTSLEPEFCALFDQDGNLLKTVFFENRRQTSAYIWDFLKKVDLEANPLTFIGGISGPGSFSSLRTTAGILNTLSLRFELPVHQVRADVVLKDILKKNKTMADTFVLNSFGDNVFYPEGSALIREEIETIAEKLKTKTVLTTFLPTEKQTAFLKSNSTKIKDMERIGLEILQKQTPQPQFVADYEFPAVS